MRADQHELPTPRTTLRTAYVRVRVCKSCRRQRDADLQALVDAGRGDVPLIHLRFRCTNCGSGLTDFVVTSTESDGAAAVIAARFLDGPTQPCGPRGGAGPQAIRQALLQSHNSGLAMLSSAQGSVAEKAGEARSPPQPREGHRGAALTRPPAP